MIINTGHVSSDKENIFELKYDFEELENLDEKYQINELKFI